MRNTISILSGLFLLPVFTIAGAWTLKKGELYGQFSYTYIRSNSLFYKNGSDLQLPRYVNDGTVQAYSEYGLTNKITLIGILPYKFTSAGTKLFKVPKNQAVTLSDTLASGKLNGFSNPTVGVRYLIRQKDWVWSTQINIIGTNNTYDHSTGLRTGYNSLGMYPSLNAGRGWNKTYFTGDMGVKIRSNDYSSEFLANLEYGYSKTKKTWFIFAASAWLSFYDGAHFDANSLYTGMYTNNQESISYGGKVIHRVAEHLHLNFSIFGSVYGNNVAHFPALTLGISGKW